MRTPCPVPTCRAAGPLADMCPMHAAKRRATAKRYRDTMRAAKSATECYVPTCSRPRWGYRTRCKKHSLEAREHQRQHNLRNSEPKIPKKKAFKAALQKVPNVAPAWEDRLKAFNAGWKR